MSDMKRARLARNRARMEVVRAAKAWSQASRNFGPEIPPAPEDALALLQEVATRLDNAVRVLETHEQAMAAIKARTRKEKDNES